MTYATPRSLEQMKDRPTCYEVGVYVNNEQIDTLAFVAKRTKMTLYKLAPEGGILKSLLTKEELDTDWEYSKDLGFTFGGRVSLRFTGKTERECRTILMQGKN